MAASLVAVPFFMPAMARFFSYWWVPVLGAAYYALICLAFDIVNQAERAAGVLPEKKKWTRF
jgi:hypothetical protein